MRIRSDMELYDLFNVLHIINMLKIFRLRWLGHVEQKEEGTLPLHIVEILVEGGLGEDPGRYAWKTWRSI